MRVILRVMHAIRYVIAIGGLTAWHGSRVILLALRGIRHDRVGSPFDRAQRAWGAGLLAATGIDVVVRGAEHLPDRPVVYISNHTSWVDIWALLAVLPGSPRFVAKKEFLSFPVIGGAMRAIGHVAIDRSNRTSAFAAYDAAAQAIRDGVSVVVFAEGTRSPTGKLQPFKKGPFVLAIAAQVPVVPIYCADTYERMPKGAFAPRPGTAEVRVGEPIATAGHSYDGRDELSHEARRVLVALGAVEA